MFCVCVCVCVCVCACVCGCVSGPIPSQSSSASSMEAVGILGPCSSCIDGPAVPSVPGRAKLGADCTELPNPFALRFEGLQAAGLEGWRFATVVRWWPGMMSSPLVLVPAYGSGLASSWLLLRCLEAVMLSVALEGLSAGLTCTVGKGSCCRGLAAPATETVATLCSPSCTECSACMWPTSPTRELCASWLGLSMSSS